ncbi:hypothetical protein FRACA_2610010 [Frankia canadensis]|uniref:Uncharacterized protein n=1 Tax=Frankia canadensis TaxID=1836972 RepID=A0A2I2KSH3_9ACTN|nr:type II toxin-antitoxin system RelE/ParE family toxin [Frankia canadensis]SNQ48624.1 hypothetical protein FRACA_2610010 [Frankia canadensis]SOU55914.1 hypothetical protein FRACA_2610010 [Frankia canadensis]
MIEAARAPSGGVEEFLRSLEGSPAGLRDLADIAVRFEAYAHDEILSFPRQINDLADGLRELKVGKIRLPFFETEHLGMTAARLTHGFRKNTDYTPRGEIDRAKRVRGEDVGL